MPHTLPSPPDPSRPARHDDRGRLSSGGPQEHVVSRGLREDREQAGDTDEVQVEDDDRVGARAEDTPNRRVTDSGTVETREALAFPGDPHVVRLRRGDDAMRR
jgi:hypothetical protein